MPSCCTFHLRHWCQTGPLVPKLEHSAKVATLHIRSCQPNGWHRLAPPAEETHITAKYIQMSPRTTVRHPFFNRKWAWQDAEKQLVYWGRVSSDVSPYSRQTLSTFWNCKPVLLTVSVDMYVSSNSETTLEESRGSRALTSTSGASSTFPIISVLQWKTGVNDKPQQNTLK